VKYLQISETISRICLLQETEKRDLKEKTCDNSTQVDLESQSNHAYADTADYPSSYSHLNRLNPVNSGLPFPDACLSLLEQTAVGSGHTVSNLGLASTSLQDRFFKLCSSSAADAGFRTQSASDMSMQVGTLPLQALNGEKSNDKLGSRYTRGLLQIINHSTCQKSN